MFENVTVRFWGVRGSYPVPGARTLRCGGNTPCVEIRTGGCTIILDAGTGIVGLGHDLLQRSTSAGQPAEALLLLTHYHHDHTQGLPFFAPLFAPSTHLYLAGPELPGCSLGEALAGVMSPPAFPITIGGIGAALEFHGLNVAGGGRPQTLCGLTVAPCFSDELRVHYLYSDTHPGGVLIYRIDCAGRSIVYATDREGGAASEPQLAAFAAGADLLIHDAQFSEQDYLGLDGRLPRRGWGHSIPAMACELARAAGVGRLILFHHEPRYDDLAIGLLEVQASDLFPRLQAAREGLEIALSRRYLIAQPAPRFAARLPALVTHQEQ